MSEPEKKITLPFSPMKQLALLGHLLSDQHFWRRCKPVIKSAWFSEPYTGEAYALILKVSESMAVARPPTVNEVLNSNAYGLLDPDKKQKVNTILSIGIKQPAQTISIEAISPELEAWEKSRIYTEMVDKTVHLFNSGKYEECFEIVKDRQNKLNLVNFSKIPEFDFLQYDELLRNQEDEWRNGLTFGLDLVDGCLVEGAGVEDDVGGGLLPGDCTLIMSPVNVGKSTTLINIAVANIFRNKNVLMVTHEGRQQDILTKLFCCALGVSKHELTLWAKDPAKRAFVDGIASFFSQKLTYMSNNRAGNTVEAVISTIRNAEQDRKLLNGGEGYDLIIDDYPANLTTQQAAGGKLGRRERDDIIYGNFVDLAGETGIHVVAAIQTNREGSKINNGIGAEERLLGLEDVSEAFGPIMRATNVITLNRPPEARQNNYIMFKIGKSRSSATGQVITCETDFVKARTHFSNPDLETPFKSIMSNCDVEAGEKTEYLLKNYSGKKLDMQQIRDTKIPGKLE